MRSLHAAATLLVCQAGQHHPPVGLVSESTAKPRNLAKSVTVE